MATSRTTAVTHLLQKALKETLGDHVAQAGSYVGEDRMRFDFSHFEAMTPEQISEVEQKVNDKILEDLKITKKEMPIAEAKKLGATALFGEKYGETVRVVSMGDYSMEFCAGTHLDSTSQIGLFKILSEGGVAAGVRRIEGVTGQGVLNYIASKDETIAQIASLMKSSANAVLDRTKAFVQNANETKKEFDALKAEVSRNMAKNLADSAVDVKGVSVITAKINDADVEQMRGMIDTIKDKYEFAAAVIASVSGDKVTFVGGATKGAVSKGVHIGKVIKEVASIAGGGGGGKPDSAQAGGKNPEKTDEALGAVTKVIEAQL